MKKVFYFSSLCAIMLFASSCTQEDILSGVIETEQEKPEQSLANLLPDGLTMELDSINVGDTINMFTEIEVDESLKLKAARNTRSSYYDDYSENIRQLVGFGVKLKVREGGSARYLRTQGVNKEIVLANFDDNSSLLYAFFPKIAPLTGEIYFESLYLDMKNLLKPKIKVGMVSAGYYSNNLDPVLYLKDGTSLTGSTWDIRPSERELDNSGAFILYNNSVSGGGANYWDFYYKCLQAEGTAVRFGKYVQKGSQEFEIIPYGDFEMVSLKLIVDDYSYAVKKPDFLVNWTYNNNSSLEQNMSTKFGKKATYKSTFSRKHSVTVSVATSLSVGGAIFAEGKITTSVANTNEWTYGTEETKEDSREYNFPIRVAPYEKVVASLYVAQYEMNLKYKAVFRDKSTGKYYTETGAWQGVDCTDINVDVQRYDAQGKIKSTTKLSGIPKSMVK